MNPESPSLKISRLSEKPNQYHKIQVLKFQGSEKKGKANKNKKINNLSN